MHCELHHSKLVKQEPPPWFTKVKAHPGPWPSILVPLLPSNCSEQAASGSRKQLQRTADSSRQPQNKISKYGKEEKMQSVTKLILKNRGTSINNQRNKNKHTGGRPTHKHRHKSKHYNTIK